MRIVSQRELITSVKRFREMAAQNALAGARVHGIRIDDAELDGLDLRGTSFADVSLRNGRLRKCMATDSQWTRCNLTGTQVIESRFSNAVFSEVIADGSTFLSVHSSNSRWSETSLLAASFTQAYLSDARICGCNFSGASLQATILDRSWFLPSQGGIISRFAFVDFGDSSLRDAHLHYLDLSQAICSTLPPRALGFWSVGSTEPSCRMRRSRGRLL